MPHMPDELLTAADVESAPRAPDEVALLDLLRDRDVSCPLCRYNLRGLSSTRCPECGRELRLSIGLLEPRQGAWLTAQIAVTAAAGIGVMIAVVSIMQGWPTGDDKQTLLNAMFVFHLAMIPAATMLLICRRRYLRLRRDVQWIGAVVAVLAVVLSMIGLAVVSV
jgi:hypothetical protein